MLKAVNAPLRRWMHVSRPLCAKILCTEPVDDVCKEILTKRSHEFVQKSLNNKELVAEIGNYDGLIVRSETQVGKEAIDAASRLQIIGRAGTGVDNIDVSHATRNGILVMNTPGANTISAAEFTMGMIMALSKRIPQGYESLKEGEWEREFSRKDGGLSGKTIGIIGLGRIGREVAKRCNAFGMTVIGYDAILAKSAAKALNVIPVSMDEVFARSDFISLHLPYQTHTRKLVNADRLALCKKGAQLINCARFGLIDYTALLQSLKTEHIGGVALDVKPSALSSENQQVWDELIQHRNVMCTPHIAALTLDAQKRVAMDVANQMADALEGKAFTGVINAPNIDFARQTKAMPYLSLAEKLGSIQAQLLANDRLTKIVVISEGKELSNADLSQAAVNSVLKGFLSCMLEEEVNFGNAREIANTMQIRIEDHRRREVEDDTYSSQLHVMLELKSGATRTISGTVFENEVRLIKFDDLRMDAVPSGRMLFFHNSDSPGVLLSITRILADNNINIANFGLGRKGTGEAVGVLQLDDYVDESVMDELSNLDGIWNIRQVNLLELPYFNGSDRFDTQEPKENDDDTMVGVHTGVSPNQKPSLRPSSPNFGSGPCKKRPGYSLSQLPSNILGRSHRSKLGEGRLFQAVEETKRILRIPKDYLVGIVPASDTGAFEMAMWNMLGERPVDMCYWEAFGKGWYTDAVKHLKLNETVGVTEISSDYGSLPDLTKTNMAHDICLTWNGTTSGVCVPNGDWISDSRQGLIFNDATSAAFAMDIPWEKTDVSTFSWQKVLGGEGAHGMMILSPRAVKRLESYHPDRPMPKIFRMKKPDGSLMRGIFKGKTINTPSMICVEDYLDALNWASDIGGVDELIRRSKDNLQVLEHFVSKHEWISFLASDPEFRSNTSVCLQLDLSPPDIAKMIALLERENIAVDIASYRDAPDGIRIWCGATVETQDVEALCPWLLWAYRQVLLTGST